MDGAAAAAATASAAEAVELITQEFQAAEAAGPAMLLGSLDHADYLPPPAAAPAPTDVSHMSIGPNENAGYVLFSISECHKSKKKFLSLPWRSIKKKYS